MCRVTVGHLRVTVGLPRVTIGHLRATIGHLRATIGHLRLTSIGYLKARGYFATYILKDFIEQGGAHDKSPG